MLDTLTTSDQLTVFISYSRDDITFADQLDAALQAFGFATKLDRHAIAGGEEWQRRLGSLIRESDTVVFILSPASARSDICTWEVDEATRLNKRIIPIIYRPLEGVAPPDPLTELNMVFFFDEPDVPDGGFGTGLARLVEALKSDLDWLREHTRLLSRATDWEKGGQPVNRLLSGDDIAAAKAWVARQPKDAPKPSPLHLDFIRASEDEAARRESAEAQRLGQIAQAQEEREAAINEKEQAQAREAEASRKAVEAAKREAETSKTVARRTWMGLIASILLALIAGGFGLYAQDQAKRARLASTALENKNTELKATNVQLKEAKILAETEQQAAVVAKEEAVKAKRAAQESAKKLLISNANLEKSNAQLVEAKRLAEQRRVAAEQALTLMLQQLVIKATYESRQTGRSFRMSQVRAKAGDDEFQRALRGANDPDAIWTSLARVLIDYAERPPWQLRDRNMQMQWARHADLIMTRVVNRTRSEARQQLRQRIRAYIGRN